MDKIFTITNSRFSLGQLVMTAEVNNMVADDEAFAKHVWNSICRHAIGDWGDVCAEDKRENDISLDSYLRLLSAYEKEGLPKIWIISEADRSVTTILFPGEY